MSDQPPQYPNYPEYPGGEDEPSRHPNGPAQPGPSPYGTPPPPPGYGTPPPPPGYGTPGYGNYQPYPRANQKAMWAMILGIVSLVCCGLFAGIPALILGYQGKREIAESRGMQNNPGMATAGIVLGWISIGLTVVAIIFYTALFALGSFSWD